MEDCLICADTFSENRLICVGECEHKGVCSICFYRLRVLLKDFSCPMCKTSLEQVIAQGTQSTKRFDEFHIWGDNAGPEFTFDHKSKMFFNRAHYRTSIEPLMISQCLLCKSNHYDSKKLRIHVQSNHNMRMCQLCIENKQVFPSEHKIYTVDEYDKHLKIGDKEGGEGHPNCDFCRQRYYDKSALFIHLKKEHETCHICIRQGIKDQYFQNYQSLEFHYNNQHYPCKIDECIQKRFVVFSDEIEWIAHMRSFHSHIQVPRSIPISFKIKRSAASSDDISFSRASDQYNEIEGVGLMLVFEAGLRAGSGSWNVGAGAVDEYPSLGGSSRKNQLQQQQQHGARNERKKSTGGVGVGVGVGVVAAAASNTSASTSTSRFRDVVEPPPTLAMRLHCAQSPSISINNTKPHPTQIPDKSTSTKTSIPRLNDLNSFPPPPSISSTGQSELQLQQKGKSSATAIKSSGDWNLAIVSTTKGKNVKKGSSTTTGSGVSVCKPSSSVSSSSGMDSSSSKNISQGEGDSEVVVDPFANYVRYNREEDEKTMSSPSPLPLHSTTSSSSSLLLSSKMPPPPPGFSVVSDSTSPPGFTPIIASTSISLTSSLTSNPSTSSYDIKQYGGQSGPGADYDSEWPVVVRPSVSSLPSPSPSDDFEPVQVPVPVPVPSTVAEGSPAVIIGGNGGGWATVGKEKDNSGQKKQQKQSQQGVAAASSSKVVNDQDFPSLSGGSTTTTTTMSGKSNRSQKSTDNKKKSQQADPVVDPFANYVLYNRDDAPPPPPGFSVVSDSTSPPGFTPILSTASTSLISSSSNDTKQDVSQMKIRSTTSDDKLGSIKVESEEAIKVKAKSKDKDKAKGTSNGLVQDEEISSISLGTRTMTGTGTGGWATVGGSGQKQQWQSQQEAAASRSKAVNTQDFPTLSTITNTNNTTTSGISDRSQQSSDKSKTPKSKLEIAVQKIPAKVVSLSGKSKAKKSHDDLLSLAFKK
eukprot:gene7254-14790_t